MSQAYPLIPLSDVYHLGTLNPEDRGQRFSSSLEYDGLSVSVCPVDWARIAELGGSPCWHLENEEALFLDMLAVKHDRDLMGEIEAWGKQTGRIENITVYRAWIENCEDETWGYMTLPTEAEARAEVADQVADDPDNTPPGLSSCVQRVSTWIPTEELAAECGMRTEWKHRYDENGLEMAVYQWAREVLPERLGCPVDGVWWNELLSPETFSAPRGGIFPGMTGRWKRQELSSVPDDENPLQEMAETLSFVDSNTIRLVHVSPEINLGSIRDRGLIAQTGSRAADIAEPHDAVYAFPDMECADSALGSWLGGEFGDPDEEPDHSNELILVEFDVPRHQTYSVTPWEIICTESIPAENIVAFYDETKVEIQVAPRKTAGDDTTLLQQPKSEALSP